jgi:hypothetical protein
MRCNTTPSTIAAKIPAITSSIITPMPPYAHAAFDALVEPADGPGFPHVEQAEQGEAGEQQPPQRDVRRQQCWEQQRDQCDPLADEFVPDQAAVIVDAERATRA